MVKYCIAKISRKTKKMFENNLNARGFSLWEKKLKSKRRLVFVSNQKVKFEKN